MDDRFDEMSELPAAERRALVDLAERLERERPVPAPAFRGNLRRLLLSRRLTQRTPRASRRFHVL